jgi:hypothetical protein
MMERPVFHWPLNAASTHYADDIVYTDDAPFTQSDKKALREFIRHRLLELSLGRDETKDVEFDTSQGTVRIHVALHPEWQRYKTIEGFLEIVEHPVVEAELPMPVAALAVKKSQQVQGLKKFTILLESGHTEFEAMYKEEQEDRYVFYDADGAILTFFYKSLCVLAIITNGTFVQLPSKSVKRLLKGLISKSC